MAQRAGSFDRRVTIQALVETYDKGRTVQAWEDAHDLYAAFTPVSGREEFRSGQRLAREEGTFRIRWSSEWSPSPKTHRVIYHGKAWDIRRVVEVGRREAWDLVAEVVGTNGGG